MDPDNAAQSPDRDTDNRTDAPASDGRPAAAGGVGPTLLRGAAGAAVVAAAVILLTLAGIIARSHSMDAPPPPLSMPYPFMQSPNCDDRPEPVTIDCIVLHATVEPTTEGTMKIFLTPEKRVSAHFVVGRDGRVVQMVRVEKRAWHAGASLLDGVARVNDFSVGIEMVNLNTGEDGYSNEQMEAVAGIIRHIRSRYDVPDARIVSHAQIAQPPGRKTDPVGLDFDKIRALVRCVPSTMAAADASPAEPVASTLRK